MDKYIGNKKSIIEDLEQFMKKKDIKKGVFFDAFTGTTNVAQYFKQRGFDLIISDSNSFSKVLGEAYVVNNSFPTFEYLLPIIEKKYSFNYSIIGDMVDKTTKKIILDKIFPMDYLQASNFAEKIVPLAKVIYFLNNLEIQSVSEKQLFFLNYYSIYGEKSSYTSLRGTKGKRNYFSKYNSIKLGVILDKTTQWKEQGLITEMELNLLLTSVIEEVTLIANVAGTFHDFNRNKLYPNATVDMNLRIPLLNISNRNGRYVAFEGDTNLLYQDDDYKSLVDEMNGVELLYIDPPYNFRQYSDYYHLLNFIADYPYIIDLDKYGEGLFYVRGQNMNNSFKSQYSYKETFDKALTELISNTYCRNVIISYYDENNHWNHGKEEVSFEGRNAIFSSLKNSKGVSHIDDEPYSIKRVNYQSRKGENKKSIDELFFFGRKEA